MNEDFDIDSMYEDRFMDDTDNEPMEYEDYGHQPEQFPDWPDFD
jgi:hypothetical protein